MIIKLLKPLLSDEKFETCISLSLFKLKNSEKFEKYVGRFEYFLPRLPKNAFVRLYVDDSVFSDKQFMDIFNTDHPNIEYYWYQDKRFLSEDGIHHDGTFGSMIRFLSFFDKTLNVDYVWVSDIDLTIKSFNYKYIQEMKKLNIPVSYVSGKCYIKKWIPQDIDFPIINFRVIINKNIVQLSKYSFDKFLKDVSENKYKSLKEEIESNKYLVERKNMYYVNTFMYGFDEYYTNTYLFKKLHKYPRIIYAILSIYSQMAKLGLNANKIAEYEKLVFSCKCIEPMKKLILEMKNVKPKLYKILN
jgi:hypothetical protein